MRFSLKNKLNPALASKLAVALAAVLLYGCGKPAAEPPKAEPPLTVQTVQPKRGAIVRSVTLPGELKAYQQATLYAKVTGYLKTIAVDKGDTVKAGALLAEIEVPELVADRARLEAEVAVAELDYHRLSESQKKAPDLVTPKSVDDAKGRLDIATANLERTETLLNYAKITAPFAGTITKRMVDPGAFIPAATAGSTPQTAAIVALADFATVRVQVAVPELESSLVQTNQPVTVTVEGLPNRKFAGTVTRFSYALDEATRTMLAEIELPNPQMELRPGMYANVKIGIEKKENALLVPVDALVLEKAGASVFTVDNGRTKKLPVKVGFNDGINAELVSGLNADQPVILVGKRTLANGQAVSTEAK